MKKIIEDLTGILVKRKLRQQAEKIHDWMIQIRRRLHEYPEPAFEEQRTAEAICEILSSLRIPFRNHMAKTGIVAFLGEQHQTRRPAVALRADMDALPVREETGLSFSSRRPGLMHACGHDGHVAMLLGAARLLREIQAEQYGPIRLIFQPAEEGKGGAREMVRQDCLEGVGLIFGGHIDCHFPTGQIAVQEGLICAYADRFEVRIAGKGGHAARPHEAVDALVAASHLVVMAQSLLTRKINPQSPAVISIGEMNAGTVPNAIASEAVLRGTIRTTDQKIRKAVFMELEHLVNGIDASFGTRSSLDLGDAYPPVINSPEATDIARIAAENVTGSRNVIPYPVPSLGGEDFSFYLQQVPGCFVRFGAALKGRQNYPAHSSRFDFDEDVLVTGACFFSECALRALEFLGRGRACRGTYGRE